MRFSIRTVLCFTACFFLAIFVTAGISSSFAKESKSVALILDASGSMRSKLPNGQSRINAAKKAVTSLVEKLDGDIRVAFRAYGHQSPTKKKNCKDTQLLTNFQAISSNRQEVIRQVNGLKARGYTPISLVLELAAGDLKAESASASRVVVLVSDGKETCPGDPCAVARALAEADASLSVHTIGFAVDVAARYQLQCIARHGRGKYFETNSADKLSEMLSTAIKTAAIKLPTQIKVSNPKPGTLELKNTTASRHAVIEVKSQKTVAHLSAVTPTVALPAGFYNVKFGNMLWRSIEVKDGEVTSIETAIIELPNASFRGQKILDPETRIEVGKLSSMRKTMNVMPSTFAIMFGSKEVLVSLKPNERRVIESGYVKFTGLPINSRSIVDEQGKKIITVSATSSGATLPPGKYAIELSDKKIPFVISNSEEVSIRTK